MADWMPVLVAQAWQVTLLIVVVATINRWVGKSRPHLAHALWLVVLVKCVTPPVWSSPSGLFCWLQPAREAIREALADEEVASFIPDVGAPELSAEAEAPRWRIATQQLPMIGEPEGVSPRTSMPVRGLTPSGSPSWFSSVDDPITANNVDWSLVLIGAWMLASIVVIGVAIARCLQCWRMLRNAPQRECSELSEQLDLLAKKLGLRRRVRLIVTESRLGPAVIGLFRTTVLLPALIVDRLNTFIDPQIDIRAS